MPNYSMNLTKNQIDLLIELYNAYQIEYDEEEFLFKANKNGAILSFHNDGLLVVEGTYDEELSLIKQRLGLVSFSAIASNDVGASDLFGPIVFCSVFVSADQVEALEALDIKDAKEMPDRKIIELAPQLTKMVEHSVVILGPEKYNSMIRRGLNMNKIRSLLHNQVIVSTQEKINKDVPAILDRFCLPKIYFNYLKGEKTIYKDISFYNKAEDIHIGIAAAHIIARYAYLAKLQQFSRFAGVRLLKGADENVDRQLVYLYKSKGYDTLRPITKLNFKNLKLNKILPPQ